MSKGEAKKDEMINFEPLWDYCLLEPLTDRKSSGGILLPTGISEDDVVRSRVIKAGPGAYRDSGTLVPNPIKPGMIVYHMARMMRMKVTINGRHFICVSGRDCVATGDAALEQ